VTTYRDRDEAGALLAQALRQWKGSRPLVLAIPRGAVPMAKTIADALGGDLDVVLVRKLPAPGSPEFAIGAVAESGWSHVADHAASAGATAEYIERATAAERETMRRRREQYTPVRPPLDPEGRVAIVVDDGLATGETMLAALHAVRARRPQRLVCAIPVASREAVELVRPHADEVVCLQTPPFFHAVGQFYRDFRQVDDAEVIAILDAAAARATPAAG
jgi:putative phosphoribosyl transferase